jgi:ketosteroid isomerase-like protein
MARRRPLVLGCCLKEGLHKMRGHFGIVAVLTVLLVGCSGPSGPTFTREDGDAIKAILSNYLTAYNKGDSEAIGAFYSGNSTMFPPNSSSIRGNDSIKSYFDIRFKRDGATDLRVDSIATQGEGNLAIVTGTYSLRNVPAGGPETRDRGKFLWVFQRLGGQWRFQYQMWSSDLPPPQPPPTATS